MKGIVCYSGGHSSALVAVEAVRKWRKENVILLNHDISPKVEDKDIKRFKKEVADYLGVAITYANMSDWKTMTPIDVCVKVGVFKVGSGTALCTNRLKTEPFMRWLKENYPVADPLKQPRDDIKILYGFDKNEEHRIQRRIGIMATNGYYTDYPLARWNRTITNIEEIGIQRPRTYELYKHANCQGCLKSGKQQWYMTYCTRPDLWKDAKDAEEKIGYTIIKGISLCELEAKFKRMKDAGIVPTEKIGQQTFWAMVRKELPEEQNSMPCECSF